MISEKIITSLTIIHCGVRMHRKSQPSIKNLFTPEFHIPLPLKLPLCGLVVFIDMDIYSEKTGISKHS